MNYTILIHTHSDYSYIWPIINDYTKKYKFKKVLAYDKIPENTCLPDCFDKYIQYDSSVIFTRRLVPILESLQEEFIFLIYDIDIIINIDMEALTTYIDLMKNNNIDRLCSAVFNGKEQIHKNNFAICNLNKPLISPSNHFVPGDCSSTIWNRLSFITFLKVFPNETYTALELKKNIINYLKTNVSCFGIQITPNLDILYIRGLTFCNKISILHITVKGKFIIPYNAYTDYEKELINIITKYNLNVDKIGYNKAHPGCYNFKRLPKI